MPRVSLVRTPHRLFPDPRRVIAKPYLPGEEKFPDGKSRVSVVVDRVMAIPEADVDAVLGDVLGRFSQRHRAFEQVLEHNFQIVAPHIGQSRISPARRRLIGAYFTHEYSIEAAALFNPSIVAAPDQQGLAPDERRFVLSLRAVGEGHISSIEFRSGVVNGRGEVRLDPVSAYAMTGMRRTPLYDKPVFRAKLAELGADEEISARVLDPLPDVFTYEDLTAGLESVERPRRALAYETIKIIHWLASSNYTVAFPRGSGVSERVLFPGGPNESEGMEDARFVRFTRADGSVLYYATYTAYDGFEILPQLIETSDFVTFRIATLNGDFAQNKGMALFPRRIDGRFVMLSRTDRENLFIMTSDNVRMWTNAEKLKTPTRPWELVQIGNCGSPIETDEGWLVLTHGVGPMRTYTIGAMLLDLEDPHRVIADLPEPMLVPGEDEREGYVPNVLYSCGAMVHGQHLVVPYGFSDHATAIAVIPLGSLLGALRRTASA